MARPKASKDDEKPAADPGVDNPVPNTRADAPADGAAETQDNDDPHALPYGTPAETPSSDPRGKTPPQRAAKTGKPKETPAIREAHDEAHLGLVNSKGEPIALDTAVVKEGGPRSRVWRATERIYEKTTIPGSHRERTRLIAGEGALLSGDDYDALAQALEDRAGNTEDGGS